MTRNTTRYPFLSRAVLTLLFGSVALVALQGPSFAQTCSCPPLGAGVVIRADQAPPPLPEYDQPPMPAPDYMWTPGYWAWNNYDYYWVPGTWVEPPHPGLLWTPGYWGFVDGVYAFHRGYWGDHVGFYGGVDYGFGYTGRGYEGGRWDNGHFFYNRTVNNFGSVHVTNVYEKNIVINNNTRVSFNGGKGGIEARPTPAEEAAARDQRVPPTPTQVEHARTASMNGALFQSNNHGRPTIAATPRPAAFSGPGVVRAKEGGPITPINTTPQALKPGVEPRPGVTPQHPTAVITPQRPEVSPAHQQEMPAARSGTAPATHGPEHNAAPALPQNNGPQGQHVLEHGRAPVQNEPHATAPAHEEMRHGPVGEHPTVAPHAEPPRVDAPRIQRPPVARPEPRPEPHATAPHPAAPRGAAPHGPEKREEH